MPTWSHIRQWYDLPAGRVFVRWGLDPVSPLAARNPNAPSRAVAPPSVALSLFWRGLSGADVLCLAAYALPCCMDWNRWSWLTDPGDKAKEEVEATEEEEDGVMELDDRHARGGAWSGGTKRFLNTEDPKTYRSTVHPHSSTSSSSSFSSSFSTIFLLINFSYLPFSVVLSLPRPSLPFLRTHPPHPYSSFSSSTILTHPGIHPPYPLRLPLQFSFFLFATFSSFSSSKI